MKEEKTNNLVRMLYPGDFIGFWWGGGFNSYMFLAAIWIEDH